MEKSSPCPFLCNKHIIYIHIKSLFGDSPLLSLLSLPPLLCFNSLINYLFNREWCLYRKILNRDPAVLMERQQGQYDKAEVWDFHLKTERSGLISSRLYGLKKKTKSKQKSHLWIGALIWPCIHDYQLHKTGACELMHIKTHFRP